MIVCARTCFQLCSRTTYGRMIVKCPQTFGHVVYRQEHQWFTILLPLLYIILCSTYLTELLIGTFE